MDYTLITWPESQALMEQPWFSECILLNDEAHLAEHGSSAYFVPKARYQELLTPPGAPGLSGAERSVAESFTAMNIYALPGTLVTCHSLSGGYPYDQEVAQKHLQLGQQYTVEQTRVHDWSTDVYLQEFPGVSFNSVFFAEVKPQPIHLTQQHPDYIRYHRS